MSDLHSSSTTPTPASFANQAQSDAGPARPATPSQSTIASRTDYMLSPSSVRSNASLSPAPSDCSAASSSVRFSPFPSPSQVTLRHGAPEVPQEQAASEQPSHAFTSPATTSHPSASAPQNSALSHAYASNRNEPNAPVGVSLATKVSQFQLQPPKAEFKPTGSFPSLPSLTTSESTASVASTASVDTTGSSTADTPNVYINGLPPHFPEDQLFALASPFGTVRSVRSFTRHVGDRASGYGFVLYDQLESALACIESLKQYKNLHPSLSKQVHKIPGTPYFHLAQSPALSASEDASNSSEAGGDESFKQKMQRLADTASTNLYIEGLPLSMDEPTLAALVAPYAIKSSRLFQTKLSDPPRIIAFVRMETRQAAEEIIERLHGRMVRGWNDAGSRISVRFADTSEQRELRRNERPTRDGGSPGRLTIAQAALLNLHGQEVSTRPRVRRHPGPVTTPSNRLGLPVSASLPVVGAGHSPLTSSSSLPVIGHHAQLGNRLAAAGTQSGLPVIGSHSTAGAQGTLRNSGPSQNHGSTLPLHPQIAAFQSGQLSTQQRAFSLGLDQPDVLDLSMPFNGGVGQSLGSSASLSSMHSDSPLSYGQDGSLVVNPAGLRQQLSGKRDFYYNDQLQALRSNGVPFVPQQADYADYDQQSFLSQPTTVSRARNGYTPAEEIILQAHSRGLRQSQLSGGLFPPQQQQMYRPTQHVNQFAEEEEQFHEQFGRQAHIGGQLGGVGQRAKNFRRRDAMAPPGFENVKEPGLRAGSFLHGGQIHQARLNSGGNTTASMQQQHDPTTSPTILHQSSPATLHNPTMQSTSHHSSQHSIDNNNAGGGSYQPHLRASTLPQQPQRSAPGKHYQSNSLSVSIPPGANISTSASSPYIHSQLHRQSKNNTSNANNSPNLNTATKHEPTSTHSNTTDNHNKKNPRTDTNTKGVSSNPSTNNQGIKLSTHHGIDPSKGKTTTTITPSATSDNVSQSSKASASEHVAGRVSPSASKRSVSAVVAPASPTTNKHPSMLSAATPAQNAYDSPLNSPALTYSSSSASLSPATPFFGSFSHPEGFHPEQKAAGDAEGGDQKTMANQPMIIVEQQHIVSDGSE